MTTPTPTNRLSESDLERISELLKDPNLDEPSEAQAWAQRVLQDARDMLAELEALNESQGGDFATKLRGMIAGHLAKKLNDRAQLTDDTKEVSLSVHVVPEGVVCDVRLWINRWKQGETT